MEVLRIGIGPLSEMHARTLAVARGELKLGPYEPKLWFRPIESAVG
jgi:predicted transcriptional regulator